MTTDILKDQIKARIREIEQAIAPLADEKVELTRQLHELMAEFKPGDIITWNNGKRKGRVFSARPWVGEEMQYQVISIRKDGTEGCEETVYPYRNPEKFTP